MTEITHICITRAVKNAYFMFESVDFVNFGYDWYFVLSLFKFLWKKKIQRDSKRTIRDFKYSFIRVEIWII